MVLPEHFRSRMFRRGVSVAEVDETIAMGWPCGDARSGVQCRTRVFSYLTEWEGKSFEEKEVTVYFKYDDQGGFIYITVKARYGSGFPRG